jgi:hypothetical protein
MKVGCSLVGCQIGAALAGENVLSITESSEFCEGSILTVGEGCKVEILAPVDVSGTVQLRKNAAFIVEQGGMATFQSGSQIISETNE